MSVTRVQSGHPDWLTQEFLIDSTGDVANLPTDCQPGSVAYTADLLFMAMFDGAQWKTIGGDS